MDGRSEARQQSGGIHHHHPALHAARGGAGTRGAAPPLCRSTVRFSVLAVPQLGACASAGRAWWLWAARISQEEVMPPPRAGHVQRRRFHPGAATDRGQRCTSAERALIASLVRDMEGDAPRADATMLNGNWRLLYASTPSVYRSSPFFWAFKQAALTLTLALLLAMTLALISTLALTLTLALALALALTLPRRWPARRPLSPSRAAACSRAMRWRR